MSNPINQDPVFPWLAAYYDGELPDERRAWVEAHLENCAKCRGELVNLRRLSSLLQLDLAPMATLPVDLFAARVIRDLPRLQQPVWRRATRSVLRYAPLGLFAVWAFFQAVVWMASGLLFVLQYLPSAQGTLALLLPFASPSGDTELLGGVSNLFTALGLGSLGSTIQDGVQFVTQLPWLSPFSLLYIGLAAVLAVLFLAWLAGLWSHRQAAER